jgi:hypothetical protein
MGWGQVMKCARGIGREPIGPAHSNPFFDMRECDIKFTDAGIMEKYAMNSLPITCMLRLTTKVICFISCSKSWIIRRMEW